MKTDKVFGKHPLRYYAPGGCCILVHFDIPACCCESLPSNRNIGCRLLVMHGVYFIFHFDGTVYCGWCGDCSMHKHRSGELTASDHITAPHRPFQSDMNAEAHPDNGGTAFSLTHPLIHK